MMLRTGNRARGAGFTLIEIMVTTVILSVGIIFIYRAFFTLLDAFNYCSNHLAVQRCIDEKIWQAQDDLTQYGQLVNETSGGSFIDRNKEFDCDLNADLIDGSGDFDLYRINLTLSWQEGMRRVNILRQAYALHPKPH